jgi:hypothetical protein
MKCQNLKAFILNDVFLDLLNDIKVLKNYQFSILQWNTNPKLLRMCLNLKTFSQLTHSLSRALALFTSQNLKS